jgi:hypothetical protein
MNNTTNLAIAAILIATTLVVGTFVTTTIGTQSAFAYQKKKRDKGNGNGNGNANTITLQKCKQAASESGFDNTADKECENLICTHLGENATCVQEGAAVSAQAAVNKTQPEKSACEQCFTSLLNQTQINKVLDIYNQVQPTHVTSLADLCRLLEQTGTQDAEDLVGALVGAGVIGTTLQEFFRCLENAGIVFVPG